MNYKNVLNNARQVLTNLDDNLLDILNIQKPVSIEYAKNLAKVVSKLSPILGNLIEFSTVELLNSVDWNNTGKWIRQDPGFPDALFESKTILPNPGIEIKAWFPLATEITARFKDSISLFEKDNIDVALIAWLPEHVIWGKPKIIDVIVVSGKSVAQARDSHYHKPPYYIIFEPEDTSGRTINLQQTNTNGYKLQEDKCDVKEAQAFVARWGKDAKKYSPDQTYQRLLRQLYANFIYRLDTNYAKIDRIEHEDIESFKEKVLNTVFHNKTIKEWSRILSSSDECSLEEALLTII